MHRSVLKDQTKDYLASVMFRTFQRTGTNCGLPRSFACARLGYVASFRVSPLYAQSNSVDLG